MRPTILCVDDEAIILMSLKQELQSQLQDTYLIETTMNPKEGLIILDELQTEHTPVSMIISDLFMPSMRGDEFLYTASERYPDAVLVLLTGTIDQNFIDEFKKNLPNAYILSKPWSAPALKNILVHLQ